MSKITILGIFVADIIFSGDKIPDVGESILGDSYNIGSGGKGCNQAIAISRLGGKVNFISKVGNDEYGKLAINTLKKNNIDTSNIIISDKHKTGVAGIYVDKNTGKNSIIIVRGAPSNLTLDEINIDLIKQSKIFLTQLETPLDVTLNCLKIAKKNGLINILNPAPACELRSDFFRLIDYFTPNETEAEFYKSIKINNIDDAKKSAKKLIKMGIKNVIITLGEKGSFYSNGKEEIYIEANRVKVVDTTGAGDAYNGGFSLALLKGHKIKDCLELANTVAGLSTTKFGAGDSMPALHEINKKV